MTPRAAERGFALLAVLLVLALLGVVGAEFAYSMRLEASAVRALKESVAGAHLAEAGIHQAVRELLRGWGFVNRCRDEPLRLYKRDGTLVERLPFRTVPLGAGHFSYEISDEEARINLNAATPERLDRLLQALGLDKRERDVVIDSIQDWRDPNDEHRLNGAESDDHYLKLAVPYRARNANFSSVRELLQVRGITGALFEGADGKRGLVDLMTVHSPGQVNLNTAEPIVLRAWGLADAEVIDVEQERCREQPYTVVPGRLAGRGLTAVTRTFRIDSVGIVNGQVTSRARAVVRRQGDTDLTVTFLEWTSGR
jgi:type II secretory pathway component PulK